MKKFLKKKSTVAIIAAYPKLTYDGAAAIYLFTCESPLYKELNRRLRERDRNALKDGFFPYTRLLFEGYRAMAEPKPRMVNRGVKKDLVSADPDSYAVGESVSHCLRSAAVSSPSVQPCGTQAATTDSRAYSLAFAADLVGLLEHDRQHRRALERYVPGLRRRPHNFPGACETCFSATRLLHLYRVTRTRLLLQIHTSRGIDIGKLSAIPSEAEILLPAGIALKITGVLAKDASGQTIVTLEDDEDAPELID